MRRLYLGLLVSCGVFLSAHTAAQAAWEPCGVVSAHPDTVVTGSGSNTTVTSNSREVVSVTADCQFDSNGAQITFQSPASYNFYFQEGSFGGFVTQVFSGTAPETITITQPAGTHYLDILEGDYPGDGLAIGGYSITAPYDLTHFQIARWVEAPSVEGVIAASPSAGTVTVGQPFTVKLVASNAVDAFNALQATVAVSSNLTVTQLTSSGTNACNLNYTDTPSVSHLSFAGGLFNSSSNSCAVYTMTLLPTAAGSGTVTLSNGGMKAYTDHSEILDSVQSGTYTIVDASPSPSPTYAQFTIETPWDTYADTISLGGTRNATLTSLFVNGSTSGVVYPTATSWSKEVSLSLGDNEFSVYGTDESSTPTATQTVTIRRHTLGDINGDGTIDLIDASLFAVDWGKTSNLTYNLSDMDSDGQVTLTDLSILAKLID